MVRAATAARLGYTRLINTTYNWLPKEERRNKYYEEKINAVVDSGRRLVADGNINADRIQEKADSIDQR